jgi:putative colanic acid biosynthesis glycosyltransferase
MKASKIVTHLNEPFLTIVTVVKDDAAGLQETRLSIEEQSISDWEHVIVYAPSSDCTERAAHSMEDEHTRAMPEEEPGIFSAMNLGMKASRGRYIQFLNAGDILHSPSSLQYVRDGMQGELWGVGAFAVRAGAHMHRFPAPTVSSPRDIATFRVRMCHPATIFDRAFLLNLGGYDPRITIAADFDLMLRASLIRYPVRIPGTVAEFRRGGTSSRMALASLHQSNNARRRVLGIEGSSRVADVAWSAYRLVRASVGATLERVTSFGADPDQSAWRRRRL